MSVRRPAFLAEMSWRFSASYSAVLDMPDASTASGIVRAIGDRMEKCPAGFAPNCADAAERS